jgi:hypothetical protein
MAKKTARGKTKKANGRKQSKEEVERVLTDGPIRKPRQKRLPGVEDRRIEELDGIAESIQDVRAQKNELSQTEKQYLVQALQLLRKHDKQVWKHGGVELVRVPGDEKVRVRLVNGEGAADEEEEDDTQREESVYAQDAAAE